VSIVAIIDIIIDLATRVYVNCCYTHFNLKVTTCIFVISVIVPMLNESGSEYRFTSAQVYETCKVTQSCPILIT